MSGRDAHRGFYSNPYFTIIECTERDDWDVVKLDTDIDNENVDIPAL